MQTKKRIRISGPKLTAFFAAVSSDRRKDSTDVILRNIAPAIFSGQTAEVKRDTRGVDISIEENVFRGQLKLDFEPSGYIRRLKSAKSQLDWQSDILVKMVGDTISVQKANRFFKRFAVGAQ